MLRLRPYHPDEAAAVLSWNTDERSFYQWTAGVLGSYPLTTEAFNAVSRYMAFIAIDEHAPVGFLTLRMPNDSFDELRIGFVIVDPAKRGRGYGKKMIQLAARYAKEIFAAKKVSLIVFENNPSACRCYQAVGFEVRGREQHHVLGEDWPCLVMEMDLQG